MFDVCSFVFDDNVLVVVDCDNDKDDDDNDDDDEEPFEFVMGLVDFALDLVELYFVLWFLRIMENVLQI